MCWKGLKSKVCMHSAARLMLLVVECVHAWAPMGAAAWCGWSTTITLCHTTSAESPHQKGCEHSPEWLFVGAIKKAMHRCT